MDPMADTAVAISTGPMVDINAVAEGMRPLLQRIAGAFIRVEMVLDPAGLWVHAESDQVEQVLLSLVVSSSDAMPLGGKLVVTTRCWQLDAPHQHRHGTIPAGRWGVLRVTDTGAPMSDSTVSRLLGTPAKALSISPPGGTDLSRVAAIVRRASGHIVVEDRGDHGSAIAICLPAPEVYSRNFSLSEETPAVLVVDGDAWLRTTSTHVLRRAGYGVLHADHASTALELLRGVTGSCIRVMLVDVDLPGEGAEVLVRQARRQLPDIQVIYTGRSRSGWSEDLLTKPFTAEELLVAVARRLGLPLTG
jgi:CheY-like chemotaxis protein